MDTCKKYTEFEKNQVLTAGQLNITFDYLENQQRSTHREMIGIGAACGFKVSWSKGNKIRLFLSKGWGNTSYGYHLSDVNQEFAYVHNYQDPTEYTPFKKIKLLELLKESIDDDETVKPLNMNHLRDYVVIIFLETQLVDLENCTGTDCDEKGKQHQHCLKKLLVSKTDYLKMMQVKNERELQEKVKGVFLLPSIVLPRPFGMVARARYLVNTDELYNYYRHSLIQVQKKLFDGLEKCFNIFNPILRNYGDTFPFLKNHLYTLFLSNMRSPCGIQYFYDFVEDLILAYNEFKEYAFHVCGDCLPDFESFPKHLAVGDVNLTNHCEPTAYRQYFIKSAIMCCGCGEQEKLLFLFRRLYLMISQFKILNPSHKNVTLKLTPSREKETPLSLRAIPYYYSVRPTTNMNADWLQKNWSSERTQHCETKEIMSYHAGLYAGNYLPTLSPLKYSLSSFNHIRIEGLVGRNVNSMYAMLIGMLEKYQTPIKVVPIKLADTYDNGLNVTQCRDKDMEDMYGMLRQELLCWMKKMEDYFAGLRIRPSRPKYIPGKTGVRGIVREKGKAVPGVRVVLDNSDYYAVTDEKGEYFFESAEAEGFHTIRAYGNGYQGTQETVNIQKEKTVVYDVNIQKMPEYAAGKVVSAHRVGEGPIRYDYPENFDSDKFVIRKPVSLVSLTEERENLFPEDFEIEMEKESLEVSRIENELRVFEVEIKDEEEMKAMPSTPIMVQILPEIEPLQAVGKDTVAEIYNDYLKGDFELEEYVNTMMGESDKKDACRLPEDLVVEVFYPLKVLDGLKQITRVIPSSFQDFEPAMLLNVYGKMLHTMENYKHTIYDKKVPPGRGTPFNPDHVTPKPHIQIPVKDPCCDRNLKIIERFQEECRFHTLISMKSAISKRAEKMHDRLLFKNFIKEHPGIEHMAGAPKGGTFVIVYNREEKVVADFAYPYVCCSDCPPIMFCQTTPIFFQLVKKHFCSNDNDRYKFMINILGGKVVGSKGVTFDKKTGEYFFTPSDPGVKIGKNIFVYEYQGRSFEFEATVFKAEASFTYDVVDVLPDENIAKVIFYADPKDAERYTYNFGDGTPDVTVDHPQISHKFNTTNEQRFTVKLITIINDDCEAEFDKEILIDTCTAEFKPVKIRENSEGVTYQFVPVKEAESHQWDFGDKATNNQEQPIHFFPYGDKTVNYKVNHQITDKNCQDSASVVISVPAMQIMISLPKSSYCFNLEKPQPISTFPVSDQVIVTGLGVKELQDQKGKFVFVPASVKKNVKKAILTMRLGLLKATTEVAITRVSAAFQKFGPTVDDNNPEMVKFKFIADDAGTGSTYRWDFGGGRFGSKSIETVLFPRTDIARKQTVILTTTLNQCSKTETMVLDITAISIGISVEKKALCPNDSNEIPIHLVPGKGIGLVTGYGVYSKGEEKRKEWFLKASAVPKDVSDFEIVYQVGEQTSVVPMQMIKVNADFTIKDPIIDIEYTNAEVSVEPLYEAESYTWEFVGFGKVEAKTVTKSIPLKSISQDISIKSTVKVGECTDTQEHKITLPGNRFGIEVPFTNICAGDKKPYVVTLHPDDPNGKLTPKTILTQDGVRYFVPSSIPLADLGATLDFTYVLAGKTIKKTFPVISGKFSTTEPNYNLRPGTGYVEFTAVTKNADSYLWNFANGKTAEGSIAKEYFETSERTRYPVSLTVKKDRCSHTVTLDIEIGKTSEIIDAIDRVVITDSIGLTEASISTILTDSRMEFLPGSASEMIIRADVFYKRLGKDITSPEKREMLIAGDLNIEIAEEIGPFLRETSKLILESEGEEVKALGVELYRTHLIQVLDIMAAQEKEIFATSNIGKIIPKMTNDLTKFKEKGLVVFDEKTLTAVNRVLGQANLTKKYGKEMLALKEVMK
jgi:hypothetical protein